MIACHVVVIRLSSQGWWQNSTPWWQAEPWGGAWGAEWLEGSNCSHDHALLLCNDCTHHITSFDLTRHDMVKQVGDVVGCHYVAPQDADWHPATSASGSGSASVEETQAETLARRMAELGLPPVPAPVLPSARRMAELGLETVLEHPEE